MPDLQPTPSREDRQSTSDRGSNHVTGPAFASGFFPGRGVSVRFGKLPPDTKAAATAQVRILVFLDPKSRCEISRLTEQSEWRTHRVEDACVVVVGAHVSHTAHWNEGEVLAILSLEPRFVHETAKVPISGVNSGDLAALGRQDALIGQLAGAFMALCRGERRPTALYVESIATVFATHAIHRLFDGEPPVDRRGGLNIEVLQRVVLHIDEHYALDYDPNALAAVTGYSRNHFARLFQKSLNQTPRAYYRGCQVEKAIDLLQTTNRKMIDIAHACGFCDETQMARWFWDLRRIVPRDVRKAARR